MGIIDRLDHEKGSKLQELKVCFQQVWIENYKVAIASSHDYNIINKMEIGSVLANW